MYTHWSDLFIGDFTVPLACGSRPLALEGGRRWIRVIKMESLGYHQPAHKEKPHTQPQNKTEADSEMYMFTDCFQRRCDTEYQSEYQSRHSSLIWLFSCAKPCWIFFAESAKSLDWYSVSHLLWTDSMPTYPSIFSVTRVQLLPFVAFSALCPVSQCKWCNVSYCSWPHCMHTYLI